MILVTSFYYIWFSWNVVLIVNGKQIDNMEREIETICLKLLLSQQPVARDLRQVSAAQK